MLLYLIRHPAVKLPSGICYGASDVPLTDHWEEDAEEIISKLEHATNPLVYSSPLLRCRLLAEKISSQVIIDNRLKELDFGKWELKPWDEIKGPEAEKWMNDFVNEPCAGGESYIDLATRVRAFLRELDKKSNETFIIITHAGVIRTIFAILEHISLHKSFDIKVDYGQIIPLRLVKGYISQALDFTE
jgi:alpha-ribazole phosphatase